VLPFLLVAAIGLIAVISWALIVVFGIGSGDPIWRWAEGTTAAHILGQVLLAIVIGLIPAGVTVLASWAGVRGFREDSGTCFWLAAQLAWGLIAIALVVIDRAKHEWLDSLGLSALDWWFAFGVVAFAMIMSGVRLRQARSRRDR